MMKKIVFLCVCILIGLFTLAACGGGGEMSETPEISDVSQASEAADESGTLSEPSEADDSSVAAVESSEMSVEESSEPSEEVSEVKPVVKEPDYTIESSFYYSSDLKLISKIKKGKKGEKDEIRYGILYQSEDDSHMLLPPEYIDVYYTYDEFDIRNTGIVVAIKDYDGGEVVIFNTKGECIGNYFSTPYLMTYNGHDTVTYHPWSKYLVFVNNDGNYIILDRGGRPLFDNITQLVVPVPIWNKYLYFETNDGKCYIAEVYCDHERPDCDHDLRFCEVENMEEYDKTHFPTIQALAEKFITAMAEKDDEAIRECMTEKLYSIFKVGKSSVFNEVYGVPRSKAEEFGFDWCNRYRFVYNWVNPLPGAESIMNYPACMPYVQIWVSRGEDGVWRVSDLRYEVEV